jgi:hypothetical protein
LLAKLSMGAALLVIVVTLTALFGLLG